MSNHKKPPIRIGSRFFHKKLERVFRIAGASQGGREGACCLLDTETFVSYTGDFVTVKDILNLKDWEINAMLGTRPGHFERVTDEPSAFERAGKAMKQITEMRADGKKPIHLTDEQCHTISQETVFSYESVRGSFKRKSNIIGGDEE